MRLHVSKPLIAWESGGPNKWHMSRFVSTLGEEPYLTLRREVFGELVKQLGQAVKDLGAVMVVHVGMATLLVNAPRWHGTLGTTRLRSIAQPMRAKWAP